MSVEGKVHSIRITSQGKIKHYVSYALEFLQNNEDEPIVLHTLPASKPTEEPPAAHKSSEEQQKVCPSLKTIPKLLSVVEIIKREYLKTLGATSSKRLHGLHQYNEIKSLEEEGYVTPGDPDDAETLREALEGKNYLKRKQTPFMRITLCKRELPGLELQGASYQKPLTRNLSKAARRRAKKREGKGVDPNVKDTATIAGHST